MEHTRSTTKKLKIILQIFVIFCVVNALATILLISPGVRYIFRIPYIVDGVPKVTYFVPIGCSVLMGLLGVVGWCGALDIHKHCVFGYALSTLIVMVGQLYLVTFYIPTETNPYIINARTEIMKAWENFEKDGNIKINFRHLEINWQCCGLNSYHDYGQINLPISCCNNLNICDEKDAYTKGCLEGYVGDLKEWLKSGFIVILVSCFAQMITSLLSLYMLFRKADVEPSRQTIYITPPPSQVTTRSAATTPTTPPGVYIAPGDIRTRIIAALSQPSEASASVPTTPEKTSRGWY